MSSSILFLGLIVAAAIIAFFVFKKFAPHKLKYVRTEDPAAQAEYEEKNAQKEQEEDLGISLEERIELSWEFLTKITERVVNYFSKSDQEQILDAGRKMVKHGAKYQHNVYQESLTIAKSPKTRGRAEKQKGGGRGV